MSKSLEAISILTKIDMSAFAGYCQAYARWKEAEEFLSKHGTIFKTPSGYIQQIPQVTIAQIYLKIMRDIYLEFGLTPASRTRLQVTVDKRNDELDEMELIIAGIPTGSQIIKGGD